MPRELENKLRIEAESKGLTGKEKNAYIYSTLRKTGWKPSREETSATDVAKKAWKKYNR